MAAAKKTATEARQYKDIMELYVPLLCNVWYSHDGNQKEVPQKDSKNIYHTTQCHHIYPKVLKSTHDRNTSQCSLQHCTQPSWSRPRCPTAEGWWDDLWWTCHLPAVKKNALMSSAGKQVPLEIFTVRELSQSPKHIQHVLSRLWFLDFNSTHEISIQDMRVEAKLNRRTK